MPERVTVARPELTTKQLNFLARKLGCFAKHSLLDICSDGSWITEISRRGGTIQAITDRADAEVAGLIMFGSPAASIQQEVHSVHRVLIRDHQVFDGNAVNPETTIALANLLSCLGKRGRLVIPLAELGGEEQQLWQVRLAGFPGRISTRTYKTGLLDYLNLSFLLRGIHQISVLEFAIDRKLNSRLEWHRLAREAVMQRQAASSAAA